MNDEVEIPENPDEPNLGDGGDDWQDGWSIPAPVYNYETGQYDTPPVCWVNPEPANIANILAIRLVEMVRIRGVDVLSLVGTDDPDYTTVTDVWKELPAYQQHITPGA